MGVFVSRPPLKQVFMLRYVLILPRARRWLLETLASHEIDRRPVADFGFERLQACFDADALRRTSLIVVEQVPHPPLKKWGMPDELADGAAAGITLDDVIFVRRGLEHDESLVFHEMVHAVQWRTLGCNRFLATYGLLLAEFGYCESPLEIMAYELQSQFDADDLRNDVTAAIARRTQELFMSFRRRSLLHRLVFLAI